MESTFSNERNWETIQTLELEDNRRRELVALVNNNRTQVYVLLIEGSRRHFVVCFNKPGVATGPVLAVKLRKDCVVVVFQTYCFVQRINSIWSSNIELDAQVETGFNPKGLFDMSTTSKKPVMAFLGSKPGTLSIKHGFRDSTDLLLSENEYGLKILNAHTSALACFALTSGGEMIATASCKGTLIRVFYTRTLSKAREFRRGLETAEVNCIVFSSCNSWLAVSSRNCTVHIFSLMPAEASIVTSAFNLLSNKSFDLPTKSFAQLHLPKSEQCPAAVAFKGRHLIVLTTDGRRQRFAFDALRGGEMKLVAEEGANDEDYVEVHSPTVYETRSSSASSQDNYEAQSLQSFSALSKDEPQDE